MSAINRTTRPVTGFATGVGYLARGFGMYGRHPGLMLLGLLPALIAFVALVAAFVAMTFYVDDAVGLLTPYLESWPELFRTLARWAAMVAIVVAWAMLSVLLYVSVTLIIGQPFYEAISRRVEAQLGGVPGEINVSFWRSLPRTIFDSLRLALLSVMFSVGLFFIGLIPVVGTIAALLLGARLLGWVLALELTSVPFERRGLRFADRKRALRQHRSMTRGFGAAAFFCTVIPIFTVIAMPAAVAGATLLSRRILQPD